MRVDAPWLGDIDPVRFGRNLDAVRELAPEAVVSSHLPPARRMLETILRHLADAPQADAFVGPDQAAFEAMMAQV